MTAFMMKQNEHFEAFKKECEAFGVEYEYSTSGHYVNFGEPDQFYVVTFQTKTIKCKGNRELMEKLLDAGFGINQYLNWKVDKNGHRHYVFHATKRYRIYKRDL